MNQDTTESFYYSKGTTFISNKKIKFMGFKEESLIQELHEIPIEYLWSAYIEEPPTWVSKWIFIIGLSYSAAFFHFIGTVI